MSLTNVSRFIRPRHEKFCQLIAQGIQQDTAYRQVYAADGKSEGVIRTNAKKLMANAMIIARIRELSTHNQAIAIAREKADQMLVDGLLEKREFSKEYILMETKALLELAKGSMKIKDALSALEFMAQILGYVGSVGKDKSPIKRKTAEDDDHTPQEAQDLSLLDQILERLADGGGNGPKDGGTLIAEPTSDPGELDAIEGPRDTAEGAVRAGR